jgi:hypothetical protein
MSSIQIGNEVIPLQKVIDPRLDINKRKTYDFLSGVQSCVWKRINANSASNTAITFSYKPSQGLILSRRMYIKYKLRLTFAGTSSGQLIKTGTDDALAQFPLQSSCSNISLRLNGSELQLSNCASVLPVLLRYSNFYDQSLDYSTAPSMIDQYQSFDDYTTLGSNRNVLANFGENTMYQTRGSLEYTIVSNTSTNAVVDVEVSEPLFIPTLLFAHMKQGPGFSNVQDLNLTFTLRNINRAWSHSNAGGSTLTSVSVQVGGATSTLPELLFQELTADATLSESVNDLNRTYLYPYKNLQTYIYDNLSGSTVSAGATSTLSVNSIQVGQIPSAVYVAVQERIDTKETGDRQWRATNSFATIQRLGFSVNGQANILSEANQEQIYQVCQENGLQDCFQSFKRFVGSSVLLQVGKDIPITSGTAAGVGTNFNLQFNQIEVKNISQSTKQYEVVVVLVFDAIFGINSTNGIQAQSLLDIQSVMRAEVVSKNYSAPYYGGFGFGDIFSGIKDAANFVGRNILKPVKDAVLPVAQTALREAVRPILQTSMGALGLGRKMKKGGLKMAGRVRKGKGLSGDNYYGSGINANNKVGIMDREELQERLNNYDEENEEEEQYE